MRWSPHFIENLPLSVRHNGRIQRIDGSNPHGRSPISFHSTSCAKSAAWWPSMAIRTRRGRPTSRSTHCSIAGRNQRASPPPTANTWPTSRAWVWWREIFTDDVLEKLPGSMAIGHTRYSTTGDSALLNAQPIRVDSTKGLIAIAHNGNLVNLGNVRARLEREGAYFQTTSDSEIIVQLIAHSKAAHAGRCDCRFAAPGGGRIFHRHDDARPHLCRARSARIPSALDGAHPQCRWPRYDRLCLGNLRLRSAARRV